MREADGCYLCAAFAQMGDREVAVWMVRSPAVKHLRGWFGCWLGRFCSLAGRGALVDGLVAIGAAALCGFAEFMRMVHSLHGR